MKLLLSLMILLYNLTILAGTAYLVDVRDWNPWWFLFSIVCLMTIDLREKKQKIFDIPGVKSVDLNAQIDDNVYTVNKQGNEMTTVYVVLVETNYEAQVMAVFTSLEEAKKYMAESPGGNQYYVEESPLL